MLEHPVVVGPHPGHPRRPHDQHVVQETAALGRVAAHQGQVLRREQHRPQRAQDVPCPGQWCPVDPRPVGAAAGQVDQRRHDGQRQAQVGTGLGHPSAADGHGIDVLLEHPDAEAAVDAVGARDLEAGIGIGVDRAAAQQHVDAALQRHLDRRPGSIVDQRQVTDEHASADGDGSGGAFVADRMPAELVPQGGHHLHGRRVGLP